MGTPSAAFLPALRPLPWPKLRQNRLKLNLSSEARPPVKHQARQQGQAQLRWQSMGRVPRERAELALGSAARNEQLTHREYASASIISTGSSDLNLSVFLIKYSQSS